MRRFAVPLIVLFAAALSVVDATRDSATADEPMHIAAGVAQARTGTWLVNVEHPPLAKQLFGWAAEIAGARETPMLSYKDFFRDTRRFVFAERPDIPRDRILLAARIAAVLFFVSLLLSAAWAAGSGSAGILAAALLTGQTALFPHGHLANDDVLLTVFVVLAIHFTARVEEAGNVLFGLPLALAIAAALATKVTAVLLLVAVPVALIALTRREDSPLGTARGAVTGLLVPFGSIVLLALFLAVYTFRDAVSPLETLGRLYDMSPGDVATAQKVEAADKGLGRYAFTFLYTLRESQAGRPAYFFGDVSTHPSPLYLVAAIVLKSPVVWLLAVVAGVFVIRRRGASARPLLFILTGLFFLVASLAGPKRGVRHVFPTIALLTIGAAAALGPLFDPPRPPPPPRERPGRPGQRPAWAERLPAPKEPEVPTRVLVGIRRRRDALLALVVAAALSPLAFGRGIGRQGELAALCGVTPLADSNLDWGQDLVRLGDLLEERGVRPEQLSIAYFGGDLPSYRIPAAADLLEGGPARRFLAVSRELELVGPQAALYPSGAPGITRARALVGPGRKAIAIGRAGDSIDLYDVGTSR